MSRFTFIVALLLVAGLVLVAAVAPDAEGEHRERSKREQMAELSCALVPTSWGDGDSFRVRCEDEGEFTLRLYAVDCVERQVGDDTDAIRLRRQARYFGIPDPVKARKIGDDAWDYVQATLGKSSFTVHTAFADGRGDGRYQRYLGYVTTASGDGLGALLVREGLARVHGVRRRHPDGRSSDELEAQLTDLELMAATERVGAWALTDWSQLPGARSRLRADERELQRLKASYPDEPLDLNSAARDELMRIPGIGEMLAQRIIEARPYDSVDDLVRVQGIGSKTLDKIRPWLEVR